MVYWNTYDSPCGKLVMKSEGECLTELSFMGGEDFKETCIEQPEMEEERRQSIPLFDEVKCWLDIYFAGEEPDFMPEMAWKGTSFRTEVWEYLKKIPYGKVVTYGDIAKEIAKKRGIAKMSAQAVGGAVGHNPIAIIVPCHRVIGENGNLTGYGGGIERKVALLKLEKSYREHFYIPKKGAAALR